MVFRIVLVSMLPEAAAGWVTLTGVSQKICRHDPAGLSKALEVVGHRNQRCADNGGFQR